MHTTGPGAVGISGGFTASDPDRQVRSISGQPDSEYGVRRVAYDIKKRLAKGMVSKIGKSRRYEPISEGLRSLTALLVLRQKIIRPLLTASGQPQPPSKPVNPTSIDDHYESLCAGMRGLFNDLGLPAWNLDNLFFIPSGKRLVPSGSRSM